MLQTCKNKIAHTMHKDLQMEHENTNKHKKLLEHIEKYKTGTTEKSKGRRRASQDLLSKSKLR